MSVLSPVHSNLGHNAKMLIDWAGLGVIFGSWMGLLGHWLPPLLTIIATLFGIVWYMIQIWESQTFQTHLMHKRQRRWDREHDRRRPRSRRHPKDDIQ